MAAGTPYIGSKISLISKAEIRYEGILYEVNSKDSTVTLSKGIHRHKTVIALFSISLVRSFGTEGRPAVKHIQPRSEVYEYIIFRGSDIKDLSVNEMPKQEEPPQDPAIVSAVSKEDEKIILKNYFHFSKPCPLGPSLLPLRHLALHTCTIAFHLLVLRTPLFHPLG